LFSLLGESGVDFLEKVLLENFKVVSVDVAAHVVIAKQGRLCEDVLEVGKLLLKKSILSSESGILLIHFFLEFLHLSNFVFELFLVAPLPHAASDCTFSVLKSLPGSFVFLGVLLVGEDAILISNYLL
jgi:hypothetical protein